MRLQQPDGMACGLPNCGVVSVAACAGVDYATARTAVWNNLPPSRRVDWKGRTYFNERTHALSELQVNFITTWSRGHRQCMAFKTWEAQHAKPGVTYMVSITGHVVTYRDGVAMDQCGLHTVATSRLGRKVMQSAIQILST
jgi:hypothetical protein